MKKILALSILFIPISIMIAAAFLTQTESVEAMPGFARKYNMSCTTCHAPFPRLKPYGDEFAGNGFVLKEQDAPRYFVNTGDENLNLIRDLPFGIRFEGFIKHHTETGNDVDFTAPYNLKLLSGGALTKNISYYFYFFFSERAEVPKIEDAFIMFNDLMGQDLDFYIGQFQVSDPLFKRELRLTYEDYYVYKLRPGASQIDLTYDRGLMLTYGLPTGTDIVLEGLNGNGIGEVPDEYAESKVYDNDKYKCGALRVSQDVNEYLRVGGFGYYGKEGKDSPNEVIMGGADATISVGIAELNMQFLERKDSNPELSDTYTPSDKVKSRGGMMELTVLPDGDRSRFYAVGLYNIIDYDHKPITYQSFTGHVGYLIRTNIRAFIEDTYEYESEENRLVLGLVTAF